MYSIFNLLNFHFYFLCYNILILQSLNHSNPPIGIIFSADCPYFHRVNTVLEYDFFFFFACYLIIKPVAYNNCQNSIKQSYLIISITVKKENNNREIVL